ncbi:MULTISPECIES: YicC/YloC family endoribonuclease [Methylosinus]|uniref:YicC family protein n=1 Tax=Methylosinus trichosporium (strain ATCC 35070 / NCIMB 11131 / UNIQEM 75 / OB3b) TaxID=595536 RepID=A0A2D2D3D5_METT3|nr:MULTISPECIES: YicC/YloC family endoribonuclease [Methylosinus]ATQ69508.1 YicC family protein [Methylosinus trichosporium OB3b]OBS51958.1 YicC family protein [Methylosinus sp. 3S-1]
MSLASMTGFARAHDTLGPWRYAWEIKTVNAKGLDLRLRAPPNFDAVEVKARALIGGRVTRGACFAGLTAKRDDSVVETRVNRAALERLLKALDDIPLHASLRPASLDGLLAVRGIVEIVEPEDDEEQRNALDAQILKTLATALDQLAASRLAEGAALSAVLTQRLDRIAGLTAQAEALPGRGAEAVRARLAQQVAALLDTGAAFDPQRLHQEAVLLAVKADIREELDRLKAHVGSARDLLGKGGPVGRRLDFIAQELSRETNTLCAKSNDGALTAIGLELKIEVEQWREQVQNIE